ncbi:uncharacterized protein LOC118748389 [Rhagoletis pomonella]|uniref:uncharacterized protein LOC118748389 n=1 Tax=Rhagoletis pomonella TaxID=28610 RepID=UPI00177DB63F|nr:uncharacterized protein LOC118748389 [Rhagoletis pomonella]
MMTTGSCSSKQGNAPVPVFHDENANPNLPLAIATTTETERETAAFEEPKSVAGSIIDAARNQENRKEPGPWNKAHDKKTPGKLFAKVPTNTDLGFSIHEDVEMAQDEDDEFTKPLQPPITEGERNYDKPFKYPPNFKSKNLPQKEWITPVTIENEPDSRTLPKYNKCYMYPRPNVEFQPEEYLAYRFFRKRGISNEFTEKRKPYWSNGIDFNIRQYPNFAKKSRPQQLGKSDTYFEPENLKSLVVCFGKMYNPKEKVEYQVEELMAQRLRRNDTILMTADMDETSCEISERVQRRKSFFPTRRSIAPKYAMTATKNNEDEVATQRKHISEFTELETKTKDIEPVVAVMDKKEVTKNINEPPVPATKSELPFEIFEDTTSTITPTAPAADLAKEVVIFHGEVPSASGPDFMFKTPALPNSTSLGSTASKAQSTNKLGFEIFSETCSVETQPIASAMEGAVGGAVYDPEETCSTQTFNIFIKSQSVSTPKMLQKSAPRKFGSVLKSIPNPPEILDSPEFPSAVEPNVDEQENALKGTSEYSPEMVKQLSTILETSEHGTTQGTHTTGGTTTKSSSSTSDGEGEREVLTRLIMPHTELETLEERSRESSTMPPEVVVSMENISLQSNTTTQAANIARAAEDEMAHKELPTIATTTVVAQAATPADIRLQTDVHIPANALNFSIFEDDRTEPLKIKQAGNFTRIDEPEDTAAGYAIRSLRFQEDKTETMPKMLMHSRSIVKFQEDKTETLLKIPIAPTAMMQLEAEKTDTKIALDPPQLPAIKNVSSNLDDSFEFFGQTPPGKSILHPRYEVSAFKECMEARTPASKRHCDADTPDVMHLKAAQAIQKQTTNSSSKSALTAFKGPALFEDELDKGALKKDALSFSTTKPQSAQKPMGPSVPAVHRVIARDSFMPDFSFIEESQPQPEAIAARTNTLANANAKPKECSTNVILTTDTNLEKRKLGVESQDLHQSAARKAAEQNNIQEQQAKSDLSDSYLKDFSEIMDSQPQSDNKWHRSATKSKLTEIQATKSSGNVSNSFLKDFSLVMESQPTKKESQKEIEFVKMVAPSTTNDEERAKFDLGSSYLKHFSMVMESQPFEIERQQQLFNSSSNKEEKTEKEVKKTKIRNSVLKDFSLVMESQPIVHENQLVQDGSLSTSTVTSTTTTKPLPIKPEIAQQRIQENNKLDLGSSRINDFSFVPESQPLENCKLWLQCKTESNKSNSNAASQNLNPTIHINDSYLKDLSMALEAPARESAKKHPQELQKLAVEPKTPAPAPPSVKPLMFLDSYMKDFSGFQGPSGNRMSAKKSSTRLTFFNDSKKASDLINPMLTDVNTNIETKTSAAQTPNRLLFLEQKPRTSIPHNPLSIRLSGEKSFELNAETAMFSTNISMIKNSTLLPPTELNTVQAPTPIKEYSLHIKQEDNVFKTPPPAVKLPPAPPNAPNVLSQSNLQQEKRTSYSTETMSAKQQSATKSSLCESKIPQPLATFQTSAKSITQPIAIDVPEDGVEADEAEAEMSIYFKHTPKTPKIQQHIWNEKSPSPKTPSQNVYVHREVDLNATAQIIDNNKEDPQVNPFNGYLQNAFLEQIEFSNYIAGLPTCMLVGHVSRLNNTTKLKVNDAVFEVLKLVGEGAYGAVYCGVNNKTGKKYALKQERPPNFWEYYICLEVHSRLNSDDLVSAFMSIDYALIGNNASVLISPFSKHGSLITVCNKIKKHTLRNVDEYVVMLLACELLSIIDHLHSINIIHADIKADNFILMKNLDYRSSQYSLQLIDFGVSIDMKLFERGQTFNYVHNENAFKCVEMREGRPWTYQLDLYGLAGVIHVMLFGKFMDIAQRANGIWMHKTHVPRYINRNLWDSIFQSLLNIRDCGSMPNLQNLRALIKEDIAEKEKFVLRKVAEFNAALSA